MTRIGSHVVFSLFSSWTISSLYLHFRILATRALPPGLSLTTNLPSILHLSSSMTIMPFCSREPTDDRQREGTISFDRRRWTVDEALPTGSRTKAGQGSVCMNAGKGGRRKERLTADVVSRTTPSHRWPSPMARHPVRTTRYDPPRNPSVHARFQQ